MKAKKPPLSPFAGKLKALKDELTANEEAKGTAKPAPRAGAAKVPVRQAPPVANSADDEHAFHRMVSGVTPLERAGARPMADLRHEAAQVNVAAEAEAVRDHLRALVEGGARFELRDDGRHVEGRRPDVAQDTFRLMRRGQLPIDARLDLHGFSAGDAREELEGFLRQVRNRGDRCVLVIHGKGDHAPRGQGVLRGEIAAWLAQGRASDSVAAFATAQPQDGGEGAVYVLLRRC